MGGDVFGNGRCVRENLPGRAFNPSIFIDPEPDAAKSYKGERLFEMPVQPGPITTPS